MQMIHIIILCFLFLFCCYCFNNGASGTTITVVNDCRFTIWPAIYGSPALNITGFELTEGNSLSFQHPPDWSGKLWGRTGCSFNGSGHGSCKIGDCGSGQMECNGRSATPPVTIADFEFEQSISDGFDVSLNDGYNLPMTIEATGGSTYTLGGCVKRGCAHDLNKWCPEELMLKSGGGCQDPCHVFRTPEYCCNSSSSCEPTSYSRLFKSACPRTGDDIRNWCRGNYNYTVRFCPPDGALSRIKVGSPLSIYDQLLSIGGNFTLGFFSEGFGIDYDDYNGSYLGIWYTGDAEGRNVWVANPNKPITLNSSSITSLSIEPNTGNLIITEGGTTLMKITDIQAGPNPNVTATLEDTGNFRLINENDKRILWQSFDHPTNVLLPGMKLGYNKRTRQNWTLTSWHSQNILDTGAFTLSWEPIDESNQRLMIRRRGQPYWASGYLGSTTFEYMYISPWLIPLNFEYNNYEQYVTIIDGPAYEDPFPMWILTEKGQITNHNISNAATPEWCYGNNASNGCMDTNYPMCRDGYFTYLKGEFAPHKTRNSTDRNSSLSISDCFVKCWYDCSCVGFDSSNTNGTGCVIWTGSNNFFVEGGETSTMKYVISPQSLDNLSKEKNMKLVWILIVVPLFLGLGLLWYIKKRKQKRQEYKRRKRDEYFLELAASESFKDVHQLESDGRYGDLLLFSFASIMTATNDFSPENKLGQGGFGPDYSQD